MSKLKILIDSSADMPAGWTDQYDLHILPMPIQIGDKTYLQGMDIDSSLFYSLVEKGENAPKTAAPSPERIQSFIETICNPGDTILCITVSSKMSSTFNMVTQAAEALANKINLIPFDSGAGSAVLAFMARMARLLEQEGHPLDVILEKLTLLRDQVMVVLTLDTLTFAHRSGRVNALQAALTSFLKIKPIIKLQSGLMDMSEMVRTRKKSLERIVKRVFERFGMEKIRVAIVHAQDFETALYLEKLLDSAVNVVETIITELSISVVANLGPKTVGVVAIPDKMI